MRILVLRFSSLGDIVLTEPIVNAVRTAYPEAEIDYLVKPGFMEIVKSIPGVDNIIARPKKISEILPELNKNNYDLIIDLHDKLYSQILRFRLKSKSVCYNKKHLTRWAIVKKLSKAEIDSTVDLYKTALTKLGISLERKHPVLLPQEEYKDKIDKLITDYSLPVNRTLIGLFPGASFNTKQYPVEWFADFIDRIPETWNTSFCILGSTADKPLAMKIKQKTEAKVYDLTGTVSPGELINLVELMDGVISNDSGPMHIAAALKKPQIALFGSTHTRLGFRPLNDKAVVIQSNLKCQPCSLHGFRECPRRHFRCMYSISPCTLMEYMQELLENSIWNL